MAINVLDFRSIQNEKNTQLAFRYSDEMGARRDERYVVTALRTVGVIGQTLVDLGRNGQPPVGRDEGIFANSVARVIRRKTAEGVVRLGQQRFLNPSVPEGMKGEEAGIFSHLCETKTEPSVHLEPGDGYETAVSVRDLKDWSIGTAVCCTELTGQGLQCAYGTQ